MNLRPALELIKRHEGLHLKAYICPAGVVSIGYGSTGEGIYLNTIWTKEKAEEELYKRVLHDYNIIKSDLPHLHNNAICALCSFTYNLGLGKYKASTLRRILKEDPPDLEEAVIQLMRWVKAGGRTLRGLVRRREEEATLLVSTE